MQGQGQGDRTEQSWPVTEVGGRVAPLLSEPPSSSPAALRSRAPPTQVGGQHTELGQQQSLFPRSRRIHCVGVAREQHSSPCGFAAVLQLENLCFW